MTNGCLQGKLHQDPGTQIIQDADYGDRKMARGVAALNAPARAETTGNEIKNEGDGDDGYAHLEDRFDSAPARVAPHVNHHGEAQLAHVLAGDETSC